MSNRRITQRHIDHIKSLEKHGRITPDIVLSDAKHASSPLHNLYEWDTEKAAEAHWLDRSREILGQIHVIIHTETVTYQLPNYVRDPSAAAKEQGYVSMDALRVESALARRALIAEVERAASALQRARIIAVGLSLEDVIDDAIARIVGVKTVVREEAEKEGPSATM